MKSLKITLATIFSLAFFTAIKTSSEVSAAPQTSNQEINKSKVKFTTMVERKKGDVPTNG